MASKLFFAMMLQAGSVHAFTCLGKFAPTHSLRYLSKRSSYAPDDDPWGARGPSGRRGGRGGVGGKGRGGRAGGPSDSSPRGAGGYQRRQRSEEFEARRTAAEGMDFIYGATPVLNALLACRRASFEELLLQDRSEAPSKDVQFAAELAGDMGITISYLPKHDMNMLADNRPHQGVILTAAPVELEQVSCLPEATGSGECWLALDEVVDPQNLGALLRSAEFLGASGVVICAKNSAALSPVVSKASAGALEIATISSTRNMPRFLEACREKGWRVVGTTLAEGSIPLGEVEVGPSTILVLGNEGHGLRHLVQRACDTLVTIEKKKGPGSAGPVAGDGNEGARRGRGGGVDSLNVAVSGGIALHHLLS
mmetsp:Transcript_58147/g.131751  ORF Transcript_58147/g.131751 Transcript_58147/m.131751 type:complete len:367 (-) Transcript_58147:65-1165(-)